MSRLIVLCGNECSLSSGCRGPLSHSDARNTHAGGVLRLGLLTRTSGPRVTRPSCTSWQGLGLFPRSASTGFGSMGRRRTCDAVAPGGLGSTPLHTAALWEVRNEHSRRHQPGRATKTDVKPGTKRAALSQRALESYRLTIRPSPIVLEAAWMDCCAARGLGRRRGRRWLPTMQADS